MTTSIYTTTGSPGFRDFLPLIIVFLLSGLAASIIVAFGNPSPRALIGYFLLGALLPVIGIVLACVRPRGVGTESVGASPTGAVPAGWYGDPWQLAQRRFWDGTRWTQHTH